MKKLLAILLAALMLLSMLVACKNKNTTPDGNNGESSADDSSSTEDLSNTVLVFKYGEDTEYRVVYHNNLSELTKSKCKGLQYQAEQKFKTDIELAWLFDGNENTDVSDYEIIIGDAKREETTSAMNELLGKAENEFAIKLFENGKIVIVASNEDSLIKAIDYFSATFIQNATTDELRLEKDFVYYEELAPTQKTPWSLEDIPAYEKGVLAKNVYRTGTNMSLDSSQSAGNMQIISQTTAEDFNEYLELLKTEGFTEIVRTENNGNIYVQFQKPKSNRTIYVYFHKAFSEARVIDDRASRPEPDFEYTCEAGPVTYYQYGMMHDPRGAGNGNCSFGKYGNNGAFDIIKLADNKLILIDGGGEPQVTPESTAALIDFLYEITGLDREAGEKITVAAWYFTHAHGDHYQFIRSIMNNAEYAQLFTFERVMHNIAHSSVMPTGSDLVSMASKISQYNPNVKYIKLHTGQNITLGNVSIDVLMTHEDAVDPITGKSIIVDNNNVCPVIKINANGKSIMYFGDWGGNDQSTKAKQDEYVFMESRLMGIYNVVIDDNGTKKNTYPMLKADVVQTAHHAINSWMVNVYTAIAPQHAFFTQADVPYSLLFHPCYKTIIDCLHTVGTPYENMYFAGKKTNWIVIDTDGNITQDSKAIEGTDEAAYYYYTTKDGEKLYLTPSGKATTTKGNNSLFTDLKGDVTSKNEFTDIIAVPVSYLELCEEVDGGKTWLDGIADIKK
ncbi:MAG: hypothetical protein E7607_07850 [Ruminococcaceae bacterium]|nr:hypothetical protein [Oscillospiraceae bacterium]